MRISLTGFLAAALTPLERHLPSAVPFHHGTWQVPLHTAGTGLLSNRSPAGRCTRLVLTFATLALPAAAQPAALDPVFAEWQAKVDPAVENALA